MKTKSLVSGLSLCLLLVAVSICDAQPASAPAANGAPASQPARGGRRGGGGRGGPLTAEDQADIAKLDKFPAWAPGAGDGNYFIGPEYTNAPEQTPKDEVPKGKVEKFTINAAESKFYAPSGLSQTRGMREITVYIPAQYVAGTAAPLIVSCDAYGAPTQLPTVLDNMIAAKRLPAIIAVMIQNGGGDGGGSERGLEYDTVSGKYAEFVEAEILPKVEKDYNVKFTKDPEGRMTLGGSSGGSASFNMAWFHPELYHKVLIYSGTFVNQHSDENYPRGAWEYAEHVIADAPAKPIRIWMHVSQNDNGSTAASAGLHNWVIANIKVAEALKAKGYHYQFIYAKEARHTDPRVIAQTYPQALEYVWKGYPMTAKP